MNATPRISLCIPTMDRYGDFLHKNIPKYLSYQHVDEVVVVDENGNDVDSLQSLTSHPKLKLFKNEYRLGPFLNKYKACHLASNPWVALMDSDNFAEANYFDTAYHYICQHRLWENPAVILMPSFARPDFDYRHLSNRIITKENIQMVLREGVKHNETLMNTGNFIIHKSLIERLNLSQELPNIIQSSSCDVIYLNTLLLEQFNPTFHIVENLEYFHNLHHSSIYLNTYLLHQEFNETIYERFRQFIR